MAARVGAVVFDVDGVVPARRRRRGPIAAALAQGPMSARLPRRVVQAEEPSCSAMATPSRSWTGPWCAGGAPVSARCLARVAGDHGRCGRPADRRRVARGQDVLRAGAQPERLSSPLHVGRSGLHGIPRSCVLLVRHRVHQARSSVLSRRAGRAAPPARPSVIHFIDDRHDNVAAARDAGMRATLLQPQWSTDSGKALRRLLDTAGYGNIMSSRSRE